MRRVPEETVTGSGVKGDSAVELVERDDFVAVMGSVCTPVAVVTAMAGSRPHGTTVSAFSSLSLAPPMVLVSLDKKSELLGHVQRSGVFAVNILGAGQAGLAAAFARKGDDKFADMQWFLDEGVPRLTGCAGWLRCAVQETVTGGDHVVVLGLVLAAAHADARPLTYHRRSFGTHQPHAESAGDSAKARRSAASGAAALEADIPDFYELPPLIGWFAFS